MVWKKIGFYRVQPRWYQRNIANKVLLMAYCGYHQLGKLQGVRQSVLSLHGRTKSQRQAQTL